MSQYVSVHGSGFPADLVEELNKAHEENAGENDDEEPYIFVLAHERMIHQAESEFIIEGVFSELSLANNRTMEIFKNYYSNY